MLTKKEIRPCPTRGDHTKKLHDIYSISSLRSSAWSVSKASRWWGANDLEWCGNRRFAGCVLVSDQESWVGTGRGGSTAVMTEWQAFVRNQVRLHGKSFAGPKLVCIDLQPYTTTQAPDRDDIPIAEL